MGSLRDVAVFLGEYRRAFHTTGALLPSSRHLARAINEKWATQSGCRHILEAGPGTGAFTSRIIQLLRPDDTLVLVELNERFVEVLRRRLETESAWAAKRDQITIRHCSLEHINGDQRFHAIVCGLPFNNFAPDVVDRLFQHILGLLDRGGTFSFFEYVGIRRLKAALVSATERRRLAAVGSTLERYLREYEIGRRRVYRNVPPAVVHHLRAVK